MPNPTDAMTQGFNNLARQATDAHALLDTFAVKRACPTDGHPRTLVERITLLGDSLRETALCAATTLDLQARVQTLEGEITACRATSESLHAASMKAGTPQAKGAPATGDTQAVTGKAYPFGLTAKQWEDAVRHFAATTKEAAPAHSLWEAWLTFTRGPAWPYVAIFLPTLLVLLIFFLASLIG